MRFSAIRVSGIGQGANAVRVSDRTPANRVADVFNECRPAAPDRTCRWRPTRRRQRTVGRLGRRDRRPGGHSADVAGRQAVRRWAVGLPGDRVPVLSAPTSGGGCRGVRRDVGGQSGRTRRRTPSGTVRPDIGAAVVYTWIRVFEIGEANMAKLSISDAAKAAGVARSTLYEKINAGEISRGPDKTIDTAELVRVFGELKNDRSADGAEQGGEGNEPERAGHALWLQELADRQQDQIERLQATVERQGEQLREADERAATERQGLLARLDRMTMLLPAPAESIPEPEPPRGFWRRVLG